MERTVEARGVDTDATSAPAEPDRRRLCARRARRGADRPGPRRQGPRSTIRPSDSTTTSDATSASRSVFCSATRMLAPSDASREIASATIRVPAGSSCAVGSSSTRCCGRMASRPAIATSCCCPPERCRGSRSASPSISSVSSADQVRAITSSRATARFIGPKATSSKTVPATCDSCVEGFWKPMPMRWLSRCIGQASVSSPSSVIRPRIWPPTVRGASPVATRQSVVLPDSDAPTSPTTAPSRQIEVDVEQGGSRRAGIPIADAGQGEGHDQTPVTRTTMRPTSSRRSAQRTRRLDARVGRPPEQRPAAGSGEATGLEGHRALLDLRDRAKDDRSDDRDDAADASPDGALGVQPARSLGGGDLRCAIHHGRHGLHRRQRDEADARADPASLEIDHQVGRPGREVEERHGATDGEDADQDLERERHALRRRGDRADAQQDRLAAGEEEQVDQKGRHGDRQRKEQGGADEPAQHARHERGQDHGGHDQQDRTDEAAQDDRGDGGDRRQGRLGQRVEPVIRARTWSPEEVGHPARWRGVRRALPATHPPRGGHLRPSSMRRSPCGKRALVRRAMAARIR